MVDIIQKARIRFRVRFCPGSRQHASRRGAGCHSKTNITGAGFFSADENWPARPRICAFEAPDDASHERGLRDVTHK